MAACLSYALPAILLPDQRLLMYDFTRFQASNYSHFRYFYRNTSFAVSTLGEWYARRRCISWIKVVSWTSERWSSHFKDPVLPSNGSTQQTPWEMILCILCTFCASFNQRITTMSVFLCINKEKLLKGKTLVHIASASKPEQHSRWR